MKWSSAFPARPAFAALLLLLLPSPAVYPQSPAPAGTPPTLPPGPLLMPVPDNTRWTLTMTSKTKETAAPVEKPRRGKGKDAAKSPKSEQPPKGGSLMVGETNGKTTHVLTVAADGARTEKWTDGNITAILNPGAPEMIFATGSMEGMPTPSWVSRENCVEIKTQGKKSYLNFRDRVVPKGTEIVQDMEHPDESSTRNSEVEATAEIDAETHLPVTVTEGSNITTYKFEPLPPNTQIIPAAIQTTLTERGQEAHDDTRKPARP